MMIDPHLVDRFTGDLAALRGGETGLLGVAVSGGPDSLALLLLSEAAAPGRVRAATVDHRLRLESGAEAAFVAGLCAKRGIPHFILPIEVTRTRRGLQAAAREARYAALGGWMRREGIGTLITAHHADDQAETLLMRLNRGSGLGGLAGIRAAAPFPQGGEGARLCRPLLRWRREDLAGIVGEAGLAPVEDPSNADEAYDRVRMRRRLAEAPWLDPEALARSAAALAEAEEAIDSVAARLFAERANRKGDALHLDPVGLPPELLRRLVLRALSAVVEGDAPRGEQVTALIADLEGGGIVTLAGVKCSGGGTWRFEPAPPRRTG
ncbi:MAG: tRNA(Ile)-lysidine synthase [Sphingomonadales bacterium]|jgi:tRNA(Ile)-lysidine synthase|nr:tRNA(Ile)-lysidine synthase [Sphingomonadales bacterium]